MRDLIIRTRNFQDRLTCHINCEHILYVDGGQEGLYTTEQSAKGGARRFVHSTDRIRWEKRTDDEGDYLRAVKR